MNRLYGSILILTSTLLTAGCLTKTGSSTPSLAPSAISSSDFSGATTATNKGGPIQISWTLPSASVSGFRVYRVGGGGELTSIAFTKSTDTSFIDSNTTFGQLYTYVVRAVDTAGIEETNTKKVTSIAYPGLYEVTITGQTTATLGLIPAVGAIDEVTIYAQAVGSTTKLTLATISPNQISVDVTGLRNGTTYNFSAQARNIELDLYDGNENVIAATTDSKSFSGFSTAEYVYRGFMTVKAFGEALGAATDPLDSLRIPKSRKVVLIAPPFQGYSDRSYKIVRIAADQGQSLDINATQACSSLTIDSCAPCGEVIPVTYDAKSSPRIFCEDYNVAPPPAKYHYAISMYDTDGTETWLEQLPSSSEPFLTTVHIPPDNMVLAHRDSINYDICKVMGKESDPKNKQRCLYSGIGATTYSSGPEKPPLNLQPYYYDFGYNLFVDRWEAACNWTKAANGGMCGTPVGGVPTPGECIGKAPTTNYNLDNSMGVNGNVYYVINWSAAGYRSCFIKKSGAWQDISASITTSEMATIMTSDPSTQDGHRPPIFFVERLRAQEICNVNIDPVYGKKRLPRLRESRGYSPLPWLPGESDRSELINLLEDGSLGHTGGPSTPYSCNTAMEKYTNGTTAISQFGFFVTNTFTRTLTDMLAPGWDFAQFDLTIGGDNKITSPAPWEKGLFFIGSLRTSDCVSRFGVQDAIGNQEEFVSDRASWINTSPYHYSVTGPPIDDPFNSDLVGFKFDDTIGIRPEQTAGWARTLSHSSPGAFSSLSVPLGLARKDTDAGEAFPINLSNPNNDQLYLLTMGSLTGANQFGNMGTGGHNNSYGNAGRWSLAVKGNRDYGFRCVLPAE